MSETSFHAGAAAPQEQTLPTPPLGGRFQWPVWKADFAVKSLWRLCAARPGALLAGLLAALLRAGLLFLVSIAIGQMVGSRTVMPWAAWGALGMLAAAALGYLGQRMVIDALQCGLTKLRQQLVHRLLGLPIGVVQHEGGERFMQAVTRDGELVNQMARACFGSLLPGCVLVLLCLCGIAAILPVLVAPLAVALALLWLARRQFSSRLSDEMSKAHEAIDDLYGQLRATTMRHELAVSHAHESHELQACRTTIERSHALMRSLTSMQTLTAELDMLLLGLALLALLAWLSTASGAAVTGGNLASVLFLLLALRGALQSMLRALHEMAQGAPALASIERVLALPPDPPHTGDVQPTRWHVSLKGVSCRLVPRAVVRGADLALEPGQVTVLTGRNGAGKTTLLRLLLGLTAADGGTVLVDAVPWARIDRAAFRSRVGYLPQNPVLFAGTIRDNVAYAAVGATDEAVRRALHAVGLGAWLDALPAGLATRLGSAGSPLSGGERQRVALARVLLREARLLLLDEPTNHLDGLGAQALMSTLRQAAGGPAVLIISHDPALIELADQVLAMSDGRLHPLRSAPA